ncbi:MAG: radical SAM protein [Candidatus Rokuibacteriota bacterium]|nr:MAG: radical SAM protein [Candidatus Rokubacteria bacterium]
MVVEQLTRSDVRTVCDAVTVGSMNLGVGENGLHSEYRGILDDLAARGIKTSITSNGLSIDTLADGQLTRFHSVELSLDFPTEREHDAFRGAGNWRTVVAALERCAGLGVPVTVTAVNVYQPSRTNRFTLTYEEFWDGFRGLAAATRLIATTEPVLAGVLGLDDFTGPGCGRSTVRIAPDGRVMPCTYWPGSRLTITDLARAGAGILEADEFVDARRTPAACAGCPCRGGCAGRRALTGQADAADPYCPFARGDGIVLDWERAARQDLPKVGSACTTVVSGLC